MKKIYSINVNEDIAENFKEIAQNAGYSLSSAIECLMTAAVNREIELVSQKPMSQYTKAPALSRRELVQILNELAIAKGMVLKKISGNGTYYIYGNNSFMLTTRNMNVNESEVFTIEGHQIHYYEEAVKREEAIIGKSIKKTVLSYVVTPSGQAIWGAFDLAHETFAKRMDSKNDSSSIFRTPGGELGDTFDWDDPTNANERRKRGSIICRVKTKNHFNKILELTRESLSTEDFEILDAQFKKKIEDIKKN